MTRGAFVAILTREEQDETKTRTREVKRRERGAGKLYGGVIRGHTAGQSAYTLLVYIRARLPTLVA